jgi:hypothetical protein
MTSKIKVNTVTTESGCTVTLGESGKNVVVANNDIRSNTYKAADGGVIASQCGTTITLGASGDTVSLASGASQSGFGRTGTVDWQTGDIKTSTFTAVNGQGFFVDTNGGAVTANLPAGSAGAIVSFQDYRNNFQNNALTITPNGSEKINTGAGPVTLSTEGEGATLVYIDSTVGWRSIQDNQFADEGQAFISATGGTITTVCTNFKVHTFTGPGSFVVSNAGAPTGSNTVDYLVVAGGGGGGGGLGGGGGAGGYRESPGTASGCYTVSPLGTSPAVALPVSVQSYPISVGGGGAGRTSPGATGGNGNPSVFSTITSTAGGGGGTVGTPPNNAGGAGGSGGGGAGQNPSSNPGPGNNPPVNPAQGKDGGVGNPSPTYFGGGGGGALANGNPGVPGCSTGGPGATSSINGTPTARGGGGSGGGDGPSTGGAPGGGGASGAFSQGNGTAGTANTGGGGGGGAGGGPTGGDGAAGGSGIVIIRYRFQ